MVTTPKALGIAELPGVQTDYKARLPPSGHLLPAGAGTWPGLQLALSGTQPSKDKRSEGEKRHETSAGGMAAS